MSLVSYRFDGDGPAKVRPVECRTAGDAIRAARLAEKRRREMFALPEKPIEIAPAPIAPVCEQPVSKFVQISGVVNAHFGLMGNFEPQTTNSDLSYKADMPFYGVSIKEIQRAVCKRAKINMSELLSPRRTKSVVKPRHIAMALCKLLTSRSLPEIARQFGGKDHTTILHATRKLEPVMAEICQLAMEGCQLHELVSAAFEAFDRLEFSLPLKPRNQA